MTDHKFVRVMNVDKVSDIKRCSACGKEVLYYGYNQSHCSGNNQFPLDIEGNILDVGTEVYVVRGDELCKGTVTRFRLITAQIWIDGNRTNYYPEKLITCPRKGPNNE